MTMNINELKSHVADKVKLAWPDFQRCHPHLAKAMDEMILTNHIAESLADDPEFQAAIAHAEVVGNIASVLRDWISKAIDRVVNLRISPD